jgi:hypothetical protein
MKKKLEADLMSIAHGVLQMKNKSDINKLYLETQKLYEKLSILRFVEDHFGEVQPTIGHTELIEKINVFFEDNKNNEITSDVVNLENIVDDSIMDVAFEKQESLVGNNDSEVTSLDKEEISVQVKLKKDFSFLPIFELDVEVEQNENPVQKPQALEISFEDYLGGDYSNTLFVKLEDEQNAAVPPLDFALPTVDNSEKLAVEGVVTDSLVVKKTALNDSFAKGIAVDLNDKIAFVNHLFGNIDEDYNRVLNQLITYDTFEEAQDFIKNMVKPDYNNWEGKEAYAERFIQIIERKFAAV